MGKFIVLIVVMAARIVNGQGWYATYQKPETGDFRSVHMFDSVSVIASGEKGIFMSPDAGETWGIIDNRFNVSSFYFLDELNGFACGDSVSASSSFYSGIIIKTSDGGKNWELLSRGFDHLKDIHFFDADSGIILGSWGKLISTSDGGRTWKVIKNFPGYPNYYNSMDFLDRNNGLVAGLSVYKTTDEGETWTAVRPDNNYGYDCAGYAPDGTIFASVRGDIHKSTDGGDSWDITEVWATIRYFHFWDNNNGIAAGDYGLTLLTSDGGKTWAKSYRGQNSLIQISFSDRMNGILAGYPGVLWRTTDGGEKWEELSSSGNESLSSVSFADELHGFAAGNYGTIIKTTDGGKIWKHVFADLKSPYIHISHFPHMQTIIMTDRNNVYAFGGNLVTKSTDGGETWKSTELTDFCYAASFIDNENGWLAGEAVLKTTDGGENWIKLKSPTTKFIDCIAFTDKNHGVIGGHGVFFYTTDGGKTWNEPELENPGEDIYYRSVCSLGNGEFAAVAGINRPNFQGVDVILMSQDGGRYWKKKYETETGLNSIQFSDTKHGNIAGFYGTILRTTNGGENWRVINLNTRENLYGIHFASNRKGAAVGIRGTIFLIDNDVVADISDEENKVYSFMLEGNYPNPFNPVTVIRYSVGSESGVRIAVYNSLGEEVRVLKDEVMPAGEY